MTAEPEPTPTAALAPFKRTELQRFPSPVPRAPAWASVLVGPCAPYVTAWFPPERRKKSWANKGS
jgi:hypothetical protein